MPRKVTKPKRPKHANRTSPAKKRTWRRFAALIVLLVAAAVSLGFFWMIWSNAGSTERAARQTATDALYRQAAAASQRIKNLVNPARPLKESLPIVPYHLPEAYAASLTAAEEVQWDVVFESRQQRGSWLSYVDLTLVTCVRYTVSPRDFGVSVQPVQCPDGPDKPAPLQDKPTDRAIQLDRRELEKHLP